MYGINLESSQILYLDHKLDISDMIVIRRVMSTTAYKHNMSQENMSMFIKIKKDSQTTKIIQGLPICPIFFPKWQQMGKISFVLELNVTHQ